MVGAVHRTEIKERENIHLIWLIVVIQILHQLNDDHTNGDKLDELR